MDMSASCSDEAGLGVARSPSPITSTALEREVVRLHRLSSATGKRAFDVAQRDSALGERTTYEGETAGRSASLKCVRHRRSAKNSLATRDNSTRLCGPLFSEAAEETFDALRARILQLEQDAE